MTMRTSQTDTSREAMPDAPKESTDSIELRPDGEQRFRAAVRAAAKSGPLHRPAKR